MPPHPLSNSKIQRYYQNERRFNGVHCRDSSPKIKDGTHAINHDEYKSIVTY